MSQAMQERMALVVSFIPSLFGSCLGLLVGGLKGVRLIALHFYQQAPLLQSQDGRRALLYGHKSPSVAGIRGASAQSQAQPDDGTNGKVLKSKIPATLPRVLEETDTSIAHLPPIIEFEKPVANGDTLISASKPKLEVEPDISVFKSFSDPPTPPLSKPVLSDVAAEKEKKALQAVIPPKAASGSNEDKLPPKGIDGELSKPLDEPAKAIPVQNFSDGQSPLLTHAHQSDQDSRESEKSFKSTSVAASPVLYESSSEDFQEPHGKPKEVSKALAGIESKPVVFERDSLSTEPTDNETLANQDGDEDESPTNTTNSTPNSPLSSKFSQNSSPNSPLDSVRKSDKKKNKGVKGAFRKIKKALSNK